MINIEMYLGFTSTRCFSRRSLNNVSITIKYLDYINNDISLFDEYIGNGYSQYFVDIGMSNKIKKLEMTSVSLEFRSFYYSFEIIDGTNMNDHTEIYINNEIINPDTKKDFLELLFPGAEEQLHEINFDKLGTNITYFIHSSSINNAIFYITKNHISIDDYRSIINEDIENSDSFKTATSINDRLDVHIGPQRYLNYINNYGAYEMNIDGYYLCINLI